MKRAILGPMLGICCGLLLLTVSVWSQAIPRNSVRLVWTAAGDDSMAGRASQVDLRYSKSAITPANFLAATRIPVPPPSPAGQLDSVDVTGLSPSTTYYFALRTGDEAGNWSAISNVVPKTTPAPPDTIPPAGCLDLRAR